MNRNDCDCEDCLSLGLLLSEIPAAGEPVRCPRCEGAGVCPDCGGDVPCDACLDTGKCLWCEEGIYHA